MNNTFFICDNYDNMARKLHESLKSANIPVRAICVNDDGFLPDDVTSVFGYFLSEKKGKRGSDICGQEKMSGVENGPEGGEEDPKGQGTVCRKNRPLYFNEIKIPEFWEIKATNNNGQVFDKSKERARIFFAEPCHKRFVKVVDWLDEKGKAAYSDHYDSKGNILARTVFNIRGERVSKSYFSADGREVIVDNFVTGDIILNYDGKVMMFKNKTEMAAYLLTVEGFNASDRIFFNSLSIPFFISQKMPALSEADRRTGGDILFWQEPVGDSIPGNMQIILNGKSGRTGKILVQNQKSYERLLQLGADRSYLEELGFIYNYKRHNSLIASDRIGNSACEIAETSGTVTVSGDRAVNKEKNLQALICTNSDRIEGLKKLVTALPEVHFNITALTEMSSKLMSLSKHDNVSLYPGARPAIFDRMFEKCHFYFDINYGNEIVDAVQRAYYNNMLVLAFDETAHNREYEAEDHIFDKNDLQKMIDYCKDIAAASPEQSREKMNLAIEKQHQKAMDEDAERYRKTVMQSGDGE